MVSGKIINPDLNPYRVDDYTKTIGMYEGISSDNVYLKMSDGSLSNSIDLGDELFKVNNKIFYQIKD